MKGVNDLIALAMCTIGVVNAFDLKGVNDIQVNDPYIFGVVNAFDLKGVNDMNHQAHAYQSL